MAVFVAIAQRPGRPLKHHDIIQHKLETYVDNFIHVFLQRNEGGILLRLHP
ncbi:hypothetical protein [Rhizobium binae]|uniref:hypothetical protein n=1 Tax=Rhizobium binae TaxID=1138190 RepID=UPI001C836C19|nr:hypothetical protein [Rhizobium binae]MBX4969365.1 hypothetical protein [Rhizobium binae]